MIPETHFQHDDIQESPSTTWFASEKCLAAESDCITTFLSTYISILSFQLVPTGPTVHYVENIIPSPTWPYLA